MSKTKFLIVSSHRTGSRYLEDCLDSHPEIRCYGEVLLGFDGPRAVLLPRPLRRWRRPAIVASSALSGALLRPARTIRRALTTPQEPEIGAVGMRLMFNQIRPTVGRLIADDPELRIVHVSRRNVVRQVVSRVQMHAMHRLNKDFSSHSTVPVEAPSVSVDPVYLVAEIHAIEHGRIKLNRVLDRHRRVELVYEDLFSSDDSVREGLASIESMIGVEVGGCGPSQLKKTGSRNLEDAVSNFDELAHALAGTRYEGMLHAP